MFNLNKEYKLGFRAIKTALAVLISLIISYLFRRPDGFYASIAAVICMRQTSEQTISIGLHRLLGTTLGGGIGYFALIILQSTSIPIKEIVPIIIAPVFVLLIIYICNLINHKSSIEIGTVVLLGIILQANHVSQSNLSALEYVGFRILDTGIGVVVAMLINRLIFPRKETQQQ
ncbi:MAG: FUSC family protein [Oscillospiraceae bacterium]|nr:FUSC family protein [Oscillospiraceae bacterium]